MRNLSTNNRWVHVRRNNCNKPKFGSLINNPGKNYKKDRWKSFKKKKNKTSYMENDNLIIKIKNRKYVYPPKAGVIIFNQNKTKLLIIKNAYNPNLSKWGLPKGHLELGESREQCASRELLEETGISLNICEKDPFIKINNSIYYIYVTDENKYHINPIDKNEIKEACFKDIIDIRKMKINRELTVAISSKLKLAKKLAKNI